MMSFKIDTFVAFILDLKAKHVRLQYWFGKDCKIKQNFIIKSVDHSISYE